MNNPTSPLIEATELRHIYLNEDVIIVDTSNGPGVKEIYEAKHLPGALYVDLNTQLADIKENAANGGRHPLPSSKQFAETLTSLGIFNDSHVVIYDNKNGSNAAARLWWMMKALGHEKVQVLNGGIQAAEKAGLAMSSAKSPIKMANPYLAGEWQLLQAGINEVEKKATGKDFIVIDVRDEYRYNGEREPIDLVAGHIPGAVNIPYTSNLDEEGLFKSPDELREKYAPVFKNIAPENIIVHCGSGITACHTLLAIAYAGLAIPALYVGSWSEWSRNNKTIATKTS
ncbi:MAG: sulfurtransferase [Rhizobacter sp.]|nr:sulfurtransferase [Ferruginibacter sp.]